MCEVLLSGVGSIQRRHPLPCPCFGLGLPTLDLGHPLGTRILSPKETARGKLKVSSEQKPLEGRKYGWETLYSF